jgi:hypothetical protein
MNSLSEAVIIGTAGLIKILRSSPSIWGEQKVSWGPQPDPKLFHIKAPKSARFRLFTTLRLFPRTFFGRSLSWSIECKGGTRPPSCRPFFQLQIGRVSSSSLSSSTSLSKLGCGTEGNILPKLLLHPIQDRSNTLVRFIT